MCGIKSRREEQRRIVGTSKQIVVCRKSRNKMMSISSDVQLVTVVQCQ